MGNRTEFMDPEEKLSTIVVSFKECIPPLSVLSRGLKFLVKAEMEFLRIPSGWFKCWVRVVSGEMDVFMDVNYARLFLQDKFVNLAKILCDYYNLGLNESD